MDININPYPHIVLSDAAIEAIIGGWEKPNDAAIHALAVEVKKWRSAGAKCPQ